MNQLSKKEWGLEDRIPFGKYKGTKLRVIMFDDIGYIVWLVGQGNFHMDNTAFAEYQKLSGE